VRLMCPEECLFLARVVENQAFPSPFLANKVRRPAVEPCKPPACRKISPRNWRMSLGQSSGHPLCGA